MAEYKLKGITSVDLKDGQMKEAELEGVENGKVLLVKTQGKLHATSSKCTHYGAPLAKGVLSSDGRITCPWHGACFNASTGDVEDAPALDPIAKYEIIEKDGAVYIKGDENAVKANRGTLNIKCSVQGTESVLVVGGGSGTLGVIEQLRQSGFKGKITVVSKEQGVSPIDRTKLSKGLIADESKVVWRSPEFYQSAGIELVKDEVNKVDFNSKTASTSSGKSFEYTTLVLATGGTPRVLPLPGLKTGELENVHLLRSVHHVQGILESAGDSPKRIVVIGSSFIGMEVGNALAGKKHEVTIVGMESAPTELVFGAQLGNIFRKLLEKNGVKFYMNAHVSHAEASETEKNKVGAVLLKDGTKLPADVVIQGVGVRPDTDFLKASSGAPQLLKDGSISVDNKFEVKGLGGVYAIGDIATYPYGTTPFEGVPVRIEHWNVAQNAGRQVAKAIMGQRTTPFTPVFWSALGVGLRYCGNTMASGGYDDVIIQGDTEVTQDKNPSFAAFYVKGDNVVAVATVNKDPVMAQSAELFRRGRMLSRSDVASGKDPLSVAL